MSGYRIESRPSIRRVAAGLRDLSTKTGFVRASTREIACRSECSHWTVREAIADLEARGDIVVVKRGRGTGPAKPGEYRINFRGGDRATPSASRRG